MIFGFGAAIAAGRTSMAHRCGFTPGMLQRCFQQQPFGELLLRRRSCEFRARRAGARDAGQRTTPTRAALMTALGL